MSFSKASTIGLVLLFLGNACLPPATAQNCIDYGSYVHWLGGVATEHQAEGVTVSGNYAYVTDELGGLKVIDVTDPVS